MSENTNVLEKNKYRETQLRKMTTYQLKEICQREKLPKNQLVSMNREDLVHLIFKYRGEKEQRQIISFCPEGLDRINAYLSRTEIEEAEDYNWGFPAKIAVYENLSIEITDDYRLAGTDLMEGNVLLVNDIGEVCLVLYIKKGPGDIYFLLKGKEISLTSYEEKDHRGQYYLVSVSEKTSDLLHDIYYGEVEHGPAHIKITKVPLLAFHTRQIGVTNLPLVIDFGSSNTTAGISRQDGSMDMVRIPKYGSDSFQTTNLIPSVIAITDAQNAESINYVYGFEALQLAKKNYINEDLPVFYDMKRWISDYDKQEHVVLPSGLRINIARKKMLEAFLKYITEIAKQYFKCGFQEVQMLAPVRQKEKFRTLFAEILSEYKVECVLDEGMAVLYHSIKRMMDKNLYESGHWYKALVIDCGGGTTDLTSGRFCIENNQVSYEIALESSYENGDTNFGGNNLTFRIMQLLKIRLADSISRNESNDSFSEDEFSLLFAENYRKIDIYGKDDFYKDLEEAYEKAENVLPTQFSNYENYSKEQYFQVKNNYYYLFSLAEEIKKVFFRGNHLYEVQVLTQDKNENQSSYFAYRQQPIIKESNRKKIVKLDKWRLSVRANNHMEALTKDLDITIYLFEAEALLRADVYSIIKKFLERPYAQNGLEQYDIIRLTGQSCESPLFVEALKEFVPGRTIQSGEYTKSEHELKLCCLKGALSWFQSVNLGYTEINHSFRVSALPYEVAVYTHEKEKKVLINSLQKEDVTGWISRFMAGQQLDLYLSDTDNKLLKTYHFLYDVDTFTKVTQEDIEDEYDDTVIQEQTDTIIDGEMKFFVWVSREQWGFYVLPVLRRNKELLRGKQNFFDFEDDTWEENFFDGTK